MKTNSLASSNLAGSGGAGQTPGACLLLFAVCLMRLHSLVVHSDCLSAAAASASPSADMARSFCSVVRPNTFGHGGTPMSLLWVKLLAEHGPY